MPLHVHHEVDAKLTLFSQVTEETVAMNTSIISATTNVTAAIIDLQQ